MPVLRQLDRDEKLQALSDHGFDNTTSHVWADEEIESYLVIPSALQTISGRSREEVDAAIADATGYGKERLAAILNRLGIGNTPPNTIVQNALSADLNAVPDELREVPRRVRRLLGLADIEEPAST